MQAIHVKTLAPTQSQSLRFKAVGLGLCAVTPNEFALDASGNAAAAAQSLLDTYNSHKDHNIKYRIAGVGTLPDNTHAVLLAVIVK